MGQVHLSQFEDDKQLSCLETILAFYPPIGNYLYKSKFYPETNFWNYVFMSHLPSQLRLAQEVMGGIYFFMSDLIQYLPTIDLIQILILLFRDIVRAIIQLCFHGFSRKVQFR